MHDHHSSHPEPSPGQTSPADEGGMANGDGMGMRLVVESETNLADSQGQGKNLLLLCYQDSSD